MSWVMVLVYMGVVMGMVLVGNIPKVISSVCELSDGRTTGKKGHICLGRGLFLDVACMGYFR